MGAITLVDTDDKVEDVAMNAMPDSFPGARPRVFLPVSFT
jgi:hypothetical protein